VLVQARSTGELGSLAEMRAVVAASFETVRYDPDPERGRAEATYAKFLSLLDLVGV
jgi:hypothetical protein